jgi:glycosyltransferase involved in cell wall biosynthesis
MTPSFVNRGETLLALIHQLAREFWFYETPFPLNYIGYHYLEEHWLSHYKNIPTLTVSQSTARDLVDLGFRDVRIVPDGIDIEPLPSVPEKEKTPTIVFVGRLKRAKLPEHAIEAYKIVKKTVPDLRLWVIGDGYMRKSLERMADENVKFFGHIPGDTKMDLVARSHILIVPAVREGWGLVVTEANAVGTPAIGYNVHGLRDSINNEVTGILCDPNPGSLADEIIQTFEQPEQLLVMSQNALEDSRNYSWEKSASVMETILGDIRCQAQAYHWFLS